MRININYKNFSVEAEFSLYENECIAFYGPSGSGKSSILRAAAGLISGADKPFLREEIGFLHQDYSLFAHLNVLKNIQTSAHKSFFQALKALLSPEACSKYHHQLLQAANLLDYKFANIASLSGGQRQRAALCAALANKPKFLLLDEPFSALDDESKRSLIELIRYLKSSLGLSVALISHNAQEVAALANRVYLLENGRIKAVLSALEFSQEFNKPL